MKRYLDKALKQIAYIILGLAIITLGVMLYKLAATKHNVAETLVEKTLSNSTYELNNFFLPLSHQIEYSSDRFKALPFSTWSTEKFNKGLFPSILKNHQITAIGIATSKGFEYNLFNKNGTWYSREGNPEISRDSSVRNRYIIHDKKLISDSTWIEEGIYQPQERPWYKGAKENKPAKFWTEPYVFNTTNEWGITVAQSWLDIEQPELEVIIAYDASLNEINEFIKKLRPTSNCEVMIMTDDKYLIFDKKIKNVLFQEQDPENIPDLFQHIIDKKTNKKPFLFEFNEENWWGSSEKYKLSNFQEINVLIAIPESDFLVEVNNLQKLLIIGFIGILLLTLLIVRIYSKQTIQQDLLIQRGKTIEEKNKEIIDSITYAKNIQNAMLPDAHEIEKHLGDAFIIYMPKDIVAGDFYWVQNKHPFVLFAVGDCTGHGVPGAMISVMCQTALNRAVLEFSLLQPNEILDKTKELFLEQFDIHNTQFNDGMDITFCLLNKKNNKLSWAGANIPLYIIKGKSNEITTLKPDKQPIGRFPIEKPFTQQEVQLEKGDRIYLFTDGFQDQFGGPKLKKLKPNNFRGLLLKTNVLEIQEQGQALIEAFLEWKGNEDQVDDVCVLGIKI